MHLVVFSTHVMGGANLTNATLESKYIYIQL